MKSLSGTASTLGTPGPGQPGLVNDTALTYDANWFHTTGRGYGDYNDLYVAGARQAQQVVYSKTGLANGTHTIRIVNRTTSVGMVDALRILTGTGPPPGGSSLLAQVNSRYVSADNAGANPLIANRDAIGPWERFTLATA